MCLGGWDDRAGGWMGTKGPGLGGFQADAAVPARATGWTKSRFAGTGALECLGRKASLVWVGTV